MIISVGTPFEQPVKPGVQYALTVYDDSVLIEEFIEGQWRPMNGDSLTNGELEVDSSMVAVSSSENNKWRISAPNSAAILAVTPVIYA